MHVDPNSPYAELTKRQQEVLERLEQGAPVKQIATDIGVSRNAVYQQIERLARQGALAETYTPSGQPPRRLGAVGTVDAAAPSAAAARERSRSSLRELAGDRRCPGGATYAQVIEGAIAAGDAVRSPTSSAASMRTASAGLPAIWSSRRCGGSRRCRPTRTTANQ